MVERNLRPVSRGDRCVCARATRALRVRDRCPIVDRRGQAHRARPPRGRGTLAHRSRMVRLCQMCRGAWIAGRWLWSAPGAPRDHRTRRWTCLAVTDQPTWDGSRPPTAGSCQGPPCAASSPRTRAVLDRDDHRCWHLPGSHTALDHPARRPVDAAWWDRVCRDDPAGRRRRRHATFVPHGTAIP